MSPALAAAQRRLAELRAERAGPRRLAVEDDAVLARLATMAAERRPSGLPSADDGRPERNRRSIDDFDGDCDCDSDCEPASAPLFSSPTPHPPSPIKVFPDLALAMLRTKTAAAGRVWLLLRTADAAGRGAWDEAAATTLLADDGSPWRLCGRRQLANLLAAGDGVYWTRAGGRVWLRSALKVAAALGVARLGGDPVALPLSALTGPIGAARAHLYAAFHSGRGRDDLLSGRREAGGPIARETLKRLSAASLNSQRAYERRAGVARRANVALGPPAGTVDEHEMAWRRGRALRRVRDDAGAHGRPGTVYLAWQLPNSYVGPHKALPRGRQKRLNRALADLFHDGMTGNGEGTIGGAGGGLAWAAKGRAARQYYRSGKAAALAKDDRERYWQAGGMWRWWPAEPAGPEELAAQEVAPLIGIKL